MAKCQTSEASSQLHTFRSRVKAMNMYFYQRLTAAIPFWKICLPSLGPPASNVPLFSLTVIAILLVPVRWESTTSFRTASSIHPHAPVHHDVQFPVYLPEHPSFSQIIYQGSHLPFSVPGTPASPTGPLSTSRPAASALSTSMSFMKSTALLCSLPLK